MWHEIKSVQKKNSTHQPEKNVACMFHLRLLGAHVIVFFSVLFVEKDIKKRNKETYIVKKSTYEKSLVA